MKSLKENLKGSFVAVTESKLPTAADLGITERVPLFHLWNIWDSSYEGLEMLYDQIEPDDEAWEQYSEVLADKIEELVVDGEMVEGPEPKLTKLSKDAKYILTWESEEADMSCWVAISSRATDADIKWLKTIFEFD